MKNNSIQIVGCSADSITVIIDLIQERFEFSEILIFKNILEEIKINFSIKPYDVKIFDKGVFPNVDAGVFFGVSGPVNKSKIFHYFHESIGLKKENYRSIISSTSYLASSSKISEGVLIDAGVIISSQSLVEFGATIKRGAVIGHHNRIGEFCDINPGVVISGKVNIGKGCVLGSGCILADNISIGDNTIIGMGSVVTKSLPSNVIAYGNPCKIIKLNDKYRIE